MSWMMIGHFCPALCGLTRVAIWNNTIYLSQIKCSYLTTKGGATPLGSILLNVVGEVFKFILSIIFLQKILYKSPKIMII